MDTHILYILSFFIGILVGLNWKFIIQLRRNLNKNIPMLVNESGNELVDANHLIDLLIHRSKVMDEMDDMKWLKGQKSLLKQYDTDTRSDMREPIWVADFIKMMSELNMDVILLKRNDQNKSVRSETHLYIHPIFF